jgi:hypothetical protein
MFGKMSTRQKTQARPHSSLTSAGDFSMPNHISGTLKAVNIGRMVDTQAVIAKTVRRDYKNELVSGDAPTISIKIPGRGTVKHGHVKDEDFQQQVNTLVSATLEKKTIPIQVSEMDASTTLESWTLEVMNPVRENFSTDINKMVLSAILAGIDSAIVNDTPGTAKFADLSEATGRVIKSRVSGKRWGVLDPSLMAQVRTSGANLFTGGTVANDLYSSFDIAQYGGTEYIGTPDISSVTYPAAFPSAISGAVANGAKQLPLASALSAAMPEGVLFTIAGVNRVDAEGNVLTGIPKTFVTAFTPAGSSFINLKSPLIFTPAAISETDRTATQVKNVSALPANNAALTLKGTLGKTYLRGVVYSESIAAIANRPLTERGKTGTVSTTTLAGMASVQWWERTGDLANGDIWQSVSRLDAAFPLLGLGGVAYYVAAA